MTERDTWKSPLEGRYASKEMKHLFSDDVKFSTWRKLWVALAEAERELGLNITDEQISEMKQYIYDINYDVATAREREVRHDVMSHVYAFGQQAKSAAGIIHLGATSCYVTDNTDIINIREGLYIIRKKLIGVIKLLADSADKHNDIPCLGYTHYQPATPITVGRREAMWLQEFVECLNDLDYVISTLKFLGCRGATGSSSTFMDLFEGDEEKVKKLDYIIAEKFGFKKVYPISAQTYPRGLDIQVTNCLSRICAGAYKMAEDIRLLQHDKEIEEPFEKNQIGSSAMAYKRNPMRSERICSLSRQVINVAKNTADTACTQFLERTLDDSANRRSALPECFLGTDAVLIICANVVDGLVVNEKVIEKRLREELPFMATELIIMEAAKKGGDRQELHEHIRQHSMKAGQRIKEEGLDNNLFELIANDPIFNLTMEEIETVCDPKKLTGRSAHQVTDYLEEVVYPILEENKNLLTDINTEVTV
jgi:adenylosuccinate lyase